MISKLKALGVCSITNCRERGHAVAAALQAAQLVKFSLHPLLPLLVS